MTDLVDILAEAGQSASTSRYVDAVFPLWCGEHALTPAEKRIVRVAVAGTLTRRELAAALGVQASTVKKQIGAICKKVGVPTFRDVVVSLLRAALAAVPSKGDA